MTDLQKLVERWVSEANLPPPHATDIYDLERLCRLAMQYAAEEVAKKIEAELDHAAINELRLPPLFGQQLGEPAVRVSAIEAAVFWIRERFKKL